MNKIDDINIIFSHIYSIIFLTDWHECIWDIEYPTDFVVDCFVMYLYLRDFPLKVKG